MKIIVCTKFIQGELNPFDAAALECALELADARTDGADPVSVFVLGMGPMAWLEPMTRLTRLGKSGNLRAVLLSDQAFAGSDTLATSRILAAAIRKLEAENEGLADWIFCGRQTIDGDTAQVGPELAALLGRGLVTHAMEISNIFQKTGETQTLSTRLGRETVTLPAVLTLERIRELRFPSLRSRPGPVTVWNREQLGLPPSLCGAAGSPTRVLKTFTSEHGRRHCQWLEPEEFLPLLEALRQKPKAGLTIPPGDVRLPLVYAVGHEVEAQARAIADEVIFVEKSTPQVIAEAVRNAEAVLWNADLWGRRTAPQTAALLGTGLCADCTALETDGKTLFLYRPARSGDILAKIECQTRPQMATVRTVGQSADVILAGGRGIAGQWAALCRLAENLQAEPAASRALVDSGNVPYEFQVGLTGRNVSPKIYVAIGISGAVQHTCAIETSDVIFAVNPDRNARIFEYADYGIPCGFQDFIPIVLPPTPNPKGDLP